MRLRHLFLLFAGLMSLLNPAALAAADSIYFLDGADAALKRLDVDTGNVQVLAEVSPFPILGGLATDGQKLYWKGHVADLDGSDQQAIDPSAMPRSVQVRLAGGALDSAGNSYFVYPQSGGIAANTPIFRYDSDGELLDSIGIYPGFSPPPGLIIDNARGKIYWAGGWNNNPAGLLERADLDGSNMQTLYTAEVLGFEDYSVYMDIDTGGGWLYWTQNLSSIVRAPLDGSAPPQVVYSEGPIYGIALLVPEPGALVFLLPLAVLLKRRR